MLTVGALLQYGKYQVEEVLAVKGSSATYRATQCDLNRSVVVKTVVAEYLAIKVGIGRFLAEARRLAELQHPHIVRVGDCFIEHGRLFLVTDFLSGQTLAQKVAQGPTLAEDALRYIRQIGQAIALMHQQGLLHRDIKPSNIMVSEDRLNATLADFNIARALLTTSIGQASNQATDSASYQAQVNSHSLGTAFIAPEPALSAHLWTSAADTYALAATLYALVTGKTPTVGWRNVLKEEKTFERMPELTHALLVGMATEMSERPSSVSEWLALLPDNDSPISLNGQASLERTDLERTDLEHTDLEQPDLASTKLAPTQIVLGDFAQATSVPAESVQADSLLNPTPAVENDLDPTLAVLEHPQPLQSLLPQPVPNRKPQQSAQTSSKCSGLRTQGASFAASSRPARFPRRALLLSAVVSGVCGVAGGFFMKTQIFSALILPSSLSTLTPPETIQETFPPTVGSQVSGAPSEPRFSEPTLNAPDPAGTAQTVPNASVSSPTPTTDAAIENPDSLYKTPDSVSSTTFKSPPYASHSQTKDLSISPPTTSTDPSFDAANPTNLEPLSPSGEAETLPVEQSPAPLPSSTEPTLP
jgi:serine/threonine protein kinase